jgi:hypothetical protein
MDHDPSRLTATDIEFITDIVQTSTHTVTSETVFRFLLTVQLSGDLFFGPLGAYTVPVSTVKCSAQMALLSRGHAVSLLTRVFGLLPKNPENISQ